jgi:hypothetical protein
MSSGDLPRRSGEAGYTFLEIAVVLSLVGMLSLLAERTLTSTREADHRLEATRTALDRGQRVLFELREDVTASRRMFQDDPVGTAYRDALDLGAAPPLADSRLPRIDETGSLGPDAAGQGGLTGNVLLFVREGDSVGAVADPAARRIRRVDTYRFVCAYPTRTARLLVFGEPPAVDLVVWRSVAFPSRGQILAIADPDERRSVVADLFARFGHRHAWDAGAPVDAAFYALDATGGIDDAPTPDFVVAEDPAVSDGGCLVSARAQLARAREDVVTRAVFAADDPQVWSPHGFEVKVAGLSGSRKVWMHLAVECPAGRASCIERHAVIAAAKDL